MDDGVTQDAVQTLIDWISQEAFCRIDTSNTAIAMASTLSYVISMAYQSRFNMYECSIC